jgi:hypothetical protein
VEEIKSPESRGETGPFVYLCVEEVVETFVEQDLVVECL